MDVSFRYSNQSLNQVKSSPNIDPQKALSAKKDIDRKVQTLMDEVRTVDETMEKAAVVKGGNIYDEKDRKKIYRHHSKALDKQDESLASVKKGTPPLAERKYLPKDPRQKAIEVAKKTFSVSKGKFDMDKDDLEDELSSLDAEIRGTEKKSSLNIREIRRSITPAVSKLARYEPSLTPSIKDAPKRDSIGDLENAISTLIDEISQERAEKKTNNPVKSLRDVGKSKQVEIRDDLLFRISVAEESALKFAIKKIVNKKQSLEVDIACIPSVNMKSLFDMDLHLTLGWRDVKSKLKVNLIGLGGDEEGLDVETPDLNKLLDNHFNIDDLKRNYEDWEVPNLIFCRMSDIIFTGTVENPDRTFFRNAYLLLKDAGELVFKELVTKDKLDNVEDQEDVFDEPSEKEFERLLSNEIKVPDDEKFILRERIRVAQECFSADEGFRFDLGSTITPCGNGYYVFRFRKISED